MTSVYSFLQTKRFFSILLTLSILTVLIGHMNWPRIGIILSHMDALLVVAAMAMFMFQILFLAARWDLLINLNHSYIPTKENSKIFFGSNLMNFVFLSSISGPIIRLILSIRAGSPWLNALCATVIDRILSMSVLMLIGVVALPFTFHVIGTVDITRAYIILVLVTFVIAFLGALYLVFHSGAIKNLIGARPFKVAKSYGLRLLNSKHLGLCLFYSLAAQFSFFLGVFYILGALNIQISFFEMMSVLPVFLPILAILISLPISIGGWGLREGGYVVALGFLGVSMENAFLASVLVGSFTMLASITLAIPVAIKGLEQFDVQKDFKPYQIMRSYLKRPSH